MPGIPPNSVRAERRLSRCGLWATGPRQLTLPIEARGLSEVIVATGSLTVTPDYDVLAWMCERWLRQPTTSGWMRPTFYELGCDLYEGPPAGRHYELLRDSIRRLSLVGVEITGFNAETGEPDPTSVYGGNLLEANWPEVVRGIDRLRVRLAEWLRREIDEGAPVRLDWRLLRSFDENQKLAKRLWIYLAAEHWKLTGRQMEGTWVACGDRIEAALGMNYERRRDARAALKRACGAIRRVDARYAAGHLDVVKFGRSWRIQAERPTWEAWRERRHEHAQVRAAIRASLTA